MMGLLRLRSLVLVGWLAWLATLVLLYVAHWFRVMHPNFLPLALLLLVQVVGGMAVVAGGLWRLVRGPERLKATSWVLLGTTPLWLDAAAVASEELISGFRPLATRA